MFSCLKLPHKWTNIEQVMIKRKMEFEGDDLI
jgi:hypothetical protein